MNIHNQNETKLFLFSLNFNNNRTISNCYYPNKNYLKLKLKKKERFYHSNPLLFSIEKLTENSVNKIQTAMKKKVLSILSNKFLLRNKQSKTQYHFKRDIFTN